MVCKFLFLMPYKELAELYGVTEACSRSNVCNAVKACLEELMNKPEFRDVDPDKLAKALRMKV